MRSDILVYLAYKYTKNGNKEELCKEMVDKRFVVLTDKKTTDLLLYLISKNIGLNPMMYLVDSTIHLTFPNANELNSLMSEIPLPVYDDDNNQFLQKIDDDGSFFLITEKKGIYILKRLEGYEFMKMCMGNSNRPNLLST
ncbi:hypothetical protein [Metallosphaera hakonensis]|uniref:Uncharacterized protein n=1 Tax=Metallosphaera hakonensis JCM 8857 = DSM 7519 TaxID=1293036 RepID=A0A2U9IWF8_9CREN|nr:hypothetical protein [Metallosphaera hakonensis]AWS00284.1 hypothetical protein DFR87_12025 [Metallosphaera hakonensis JCM 8857 = DSM 7519]